MDPQEAEPLPSGLMVHDLEKFSKAKNKNASPVDQVGQLGQMGPLGHLGQLNHMGQLGQVGHPLGQPGRLGQAWGSLVNWIHVARCRFGSME